jgi:hypothetical protein
MGFFGCAGWASTDDLGVRWHRSRLEPAETRPAAGPESSERLAVANAPGELLCVSDKGLPRNMKINPRDHLDFATPDRFRAQGF